MIKQTLKLKTFDSADHFIGKYIKDERIKNMLSFQTLYIGISPYNGPSLYSIIPMIEFLYGVWFIKGGMHTMATSMEKLFYELGGKIHYNADVEKISIESGRANGIYVNGKKEEADYVMCNADFPYAMKELVQDKKAKGKYTDEKIDAMKYSCSCFLLYLGTNRKYDQVEGVHNFVFKSEMKKNINDIFSGEKLQDGAFYIHIPSMAPEGKEAIYVLLPVSELSAAKYEWNDETIQ